VASVNTGNEGRDKNLLGKDFFDVDNFPHISFAINNYDAAYCEGSYII